MTDDRKIPTPAEFERAASQAPGSKFLRFFKRAKRFQVKEGVGESKDVLRPHHLPPLARPEETITSPDPVIDAAPTPPITSPNPIPFERAPAPAKKPSSRRPINISPEVKAQRASSAAASTSSDEQQWTPAWPQGLSEAELRKRIGSTQNYLDRD